MDYLGLAHELKRALATYTESGGTGRTALDQSEAVAVMIEKYEICRGLFHGFDWSKWTTGTPAERLTLLPSAQEHILAQENGKDRCVQSVRELSQAFALAVPHEEAIRIRDDVAFFQAVQSVLAKRAPSDTRTEEELDHAVRQIISARWRRKESSTSSPPPAWRSPTSRSCRISFWPRCAACRSGISRSSCCRSS